MDLKDTARTTLNAFLKIKKQNQQKNQGVFVKHYMYVPGGNKVRKKLFLASRSK